MITLTITEIVRHPNKLREALKKGEVQITWKEPKPNGKVTFSAIAKKQGKTKC